jgi:GxxExxY protein
MSSYILYKEESAMITGAIFEVHKRLGVGLLEKVYQEALEQEFLLQGIPFEREKEFEVIYKGKALQQKYVADFVCFDKIIVELKAVEELIPFHTSQVLNYLNITGLQLGLLVNFNARKVVPRRIVRFDIQEEE